MVPHVKKERALHASARKPGSPITFFDMTPQNVMQLCKHLFEPDSAGSQQMEEPETVTPSHLQAMGKMHSHCSRNMQFPVASKRASICTPESEVRSGRVEGLGTKT